MALLGTQMESVAAKAWGALFPRTMQGLLGRRASPGAAIYLSVCLSEVGALCQPVAPCTSPQSIQRISCSG